jgi:hypothetical protein
MSSLLTNLKVNSDGYLYIPYSEDFNFGSGDFTIEFWVKFNSWSDAKSILTKGWPASSSDSFLIYTEGGSKVTFYASSNGSGWQVSSSQNIISDVSLNKWYYITVTRSGSTFRTFSNGVQTASWTNGNAIFNNVSHGISIGNSETGSHPVDCNIDGLRITKGVCRYSSNFSLPFNDTSLVTEGAFKDRSRFSKRVLNNYTNTSTNIKKFGDSGASFNGSGNYLSVTDSNNLNFRSDNFTIEYWIYLNSISGTIGIMGKRATESNYAPYYMEILSSKLKLYMSTTGSSWLTPLSTSDLLINTWYHIAAVRSDSNISLYVDGSLVDSIVTSDALMVNYDPLYIGASSGSPSGAGTLNGYIDDFRITKGVARYSANFPKPAAPAPNLGLGPIAPSGPSGLAVTERDSIFKVSLTAPTFDGRSSITSYNFQYSEDGSTWNNTSVVSDPYYDKVSLLLPMTGSNNSTNIVDDSKHNNNVSLVGNVKVVSAESWFGNGSAVFDGTSDNLVVENNSAFDLTGQDWTIEAWIRPTGDWSKYNTIISKRGNGGSEGTDGDWQLYLRQSSGVLCFYPGTIGGQESGSTPLVNIWNHVAAVRSGRIITLYLNGISVLSFSADTIYTTNRKVRVGGWPVSNEYFYGNMNDVRVTKGVARYTSNFDPRTLPQAPANRVNGLSTLGTPYTFRARSVNSVGSSEYSSSTTSAITTLAAPSNLNVITDDDRAYVNWTAPSVNNSAIKDYAVQYKSDGESTWTNYAHTPSIDTSIMVSGLLVGTSYSFQVAAINIAGTGNYVSTTSSVLTALRQDNTHNKTRLLLHLDSN